MIYVDSSVALAQLLAEDRVPPVALWGQDLVTSRLLVYEVWTRLHARGLGGSHAASARALFDQLSLLELSPEILARGQEAFPGVVRSLDALHLASIDWLQRQGVAIRLATYDARLAEAARRLSIPLEPL